MDAEKVFNKIHWGFVFKTLGKFWFQGNISSAIAARYTSYRVLANGVLSRHFTITNGTRQGCPLSPRIFDLVMEPLAAANRSHLGIRGVAIAGIQHKSNRFVDDVILTLTDVERSLSNTTELLDLYGSLTYYKVNTSKSLILDLSLAPGVKQK